MLTGKATYFPTIFQAIKEQNPQLTTAMYTTWEVWHKSWPQDLIDFEHYETPTYDPAVLGQRFIDEVLLTGDVPDFSMIYLEDLDSVGHSSGWGSNAYYEMVTALDTQIGQILSALQQTNSLDSTLVVLVSDHGGVGQGHGNIDVPTMYTPVILRGPGHTVQLQNSLPNSRVPMLSRSRCGECSQFRCPWNSSVFSWIGTTRFMDISTDI
eukprot:TRINITY_DN4654_c0_g1_i1.p1 TRINITY_DN4654_c0_g1~~TRINITY_DN4654_c0_g1_i1.p1  ORF type:complete len:210 (+),score=8.73 TRINITY_DN4654_c0_g1_i1:211-840(+)